MPAGFLNCVRRGGRVWTENGPVKKYGKTLKSGEYCRFCEIDGRVYAGETKKKKK